MRYDRKTVRVLPLSDQFLNPELVYTPGGLDKFLVGLATQPAQKFDNIITEEVTNHLFQAKDKEFGMDLISLNLQRGRDHGLQGYNAFRELCGFGRAEKFSQLSDLIPVKIVERLKLIYADVDDVDLFIGGISEAAAVGSLLGPTFQVFKLLFVRTIIILIFQVHRWGSVQEASARRQVSGCFKLLKEVFVLSFYEDKSSIL